jgi:hypothetical protein
VLEPISVVLRVPELMQTPLSWVGAKAEVGQGQIQLQQFSVQSQAFDAESHGAIPMADVLTNSPLNLPVTLSLRRSLAEKAHLLPANTPTNTTYVALPSFVTLAGTLGDPKSEINKLVIGGLLFRSVGGLAPIGGKAGDILQEIGGALSGQSSATGNTNGTSNAKTNSTSALVDGISSLLAPKKDRTSANASATNAAPASTNKTSKPNALDLLKLIPDKK